MAIASPDMPGRYAILGELHNQLPGIRSIEQLVQCFRRVLQPPNDIDAVFDLALLIPLCERADRARSYLIANTS